MKQKVFFTPQYPAEPKKGMGYVVVNREIAESISITATYRPIGYGACKKAIAYQTICSKSWHRLKQNYGFHL